MRETLREMIEMIYIPGGISIGERSSTSKKGARSQVAVTTLTPMILVVNQNLRVSSNYTDLDQGDP